MWWFVFEDDKEPVGLRESGDWGPWKTEDDAIDALVGEFLTDDPSLLCYELVEIEGDFEPGPMTWVPENNAAC